MGCGGVGVGRDGRQKLRWAPKRAAAGAVVGNRELRRFLESATPARAVVGGEAGCGAGVDVGRGGRQSSSRQVSRTAVGRRGIFWAVLKP